MAIAWRPCAATSPRSVWQLLLPISLVGRSVPELVEGQEPPVETHAEVQIARRDVKRTQKRRENPQQRLTAATPNSPFGDRVTAREKEVLALCILGLTNREIGERLYISPGTVKTHIDNLFVKIDCSNRTALAVRSLQLGLVDWPSSMGN